MDAGNGRPPAAYREQTVEIALGPKGAFENGNVGTLTRLVPADRVVALLVFAFAIAGPLLSDVQGRPRAAPFRGHMKAGCFRLGGTVDRRRSPCAYYSGNHAHRE
jgi:hypothetical protein